MSTYRMAVVRSGAPVTDDDVLVYDHTDGTWVPSDAPAGGDTSGTVTSVNGVGPDESGNVTIEAGGVDIKVGGTQPTSGWWLDTGTTTDVPVTANVPTANDTANTITWTPKTGVQYVIGGTARTSPYSVGDVTATVTVTAQATAGYVLTGPSSWSFVFTESGGGGDVTPPNPGTLAVTGSGDAGTTRTLTVTGASDAVGLHAQPYRFSTDGGGTWSTYQSSNAFTTPALTAGTYQPRVMVRDAAGNTATATAADFTVAAAPTPVTPTGPTWTDDTTNGGGTWTTPTQTGVTYSPASGTATPEQSVTVTATAQSGYVLTGTTSWTHIFPAEPAPAGPILEDTFNRADTAAGGLGVAETGQSWVDPSTKWAIVGNTAAAPGTNGSDTIVRADVGQTSVRATWTVRYNGTNGFYGVHVAKTAGVDSSGYRVGGKLGETLITVGVRTDAGGVTGSAYHPSTDGGSPTPFADGDVFELTVVETGTQALITFKQNGVTLCENKPYANADRPTGTWVALATQDVGSRGGIDQITVYGA